MALNQEFDRFARRAYGISGNTLLAKIEKGESGGSGTAVSKAGARGWFQFMPATRQAVLQYTGGKVDPWRSEGEARQAAMLHLLGKLGNRRGLSGYNPGDPSYPRYILNQQVGSQPGGTSDGSSGSRSSTTRTTTTTRTTPGVDRSGERRALILNWLQTRNQPGSLVQLASGLQGAQDTPGHTVRTTSSAPVAGGSGSHDLASFGGKQVAAWIKPLLQYARARGWKGTVTSGYRSDKEQTAIYKSGVRPAAVPKSMGGSGSKHEQTGFLQGAIDVTDAATLDRILKAKRSRLQWTGSRDPVHFSHQTGGTY